MHFKVPFDDHLKEQLGDYSPAVPDHIWENVRQKKDKKRPFFFFLRNPVFIILSIVATGGLVSYYLFNSSEHKTNFLASKQSVSENSFISNSTTKNENDVVTHRSKTVRNSSIIGELNNESIAENASNDNLNTQKDNRQTHQVSEHDKSVKKEQPKEDNITKKQTKSHTESRSAVSISQPSIDEESNNNQTYSATQFSDELSMMNSPLPVDLISIPKSAIPQLRTPLKIQLNIPCPEDNKNLAANKKYIELYTAVDYALRQFSDTPNSTYMRMRKESTSFASAYSTGVRFTKVFNNGINLRAGLNFSQINEKFKFVEGNIIQVVFIINAAGDTTGSYQTTSTRYKTSYNHYKTLDIPFTLGYEMSKGKWNVNFNTGLIVNIHSWNQGEVLDDSLQPVDISGEIQNPYQFKSNIGIGGIGAVSFYYSLNNRLSILAEPYLRYNFSSMSKSEISLKQKYHTSGVKFGIRLNL